ncbi:MAG: pantoate--beta-alanine ligase [Desulfopila sp.]
MKIVQEIPLLRATVEEWRRQGQKIGLVPTMGFFHQGHLALMKTAKSCCDKVVTSLFVNPLQFGPGEDLTSYPRDVARDRGLAEEAGVDILFCPQPEAMYGGNFQTRITVEHLSQGLCGEDRPGHFDGVATVVSKLFLAAQPHVAVFGQKDYQQLAIVKQLVNDLNFGIEIIAHPIVREDDGLAMSSRNKYLTPHERKIAVCLYQAICAARKLYRQQGEQLLADEVVQLVRSQIEHYPECGIDYVAIVDQTTLRPTEKCNKFSQIMLAVKINGRVRLIDNAPLDETA